MAGKKEKSGKAKKAKSAAEKSSMSSGGTVTAGGVETYSWDPSFHRGTSKFTFPNGDTYEGDFCAHLSGLVWREGVGTYTTADGQIYKGKWDGDKLVENQDIEIIYPDGTQFSGNIFKNKYSGPGVCQLEEKVSLICNFQDNKPSGEITLIDPNQKVWHGEADKNDALLLPEHAFYKNIPENRGKCRLKQLLPRKSTSKNSVSRSLAFSKTSQREQEDEEVSKKYASWRWLEEQIFAKSMLITDDLTLYFENSEWYQDYAKFRDQHEPIVLKVKETGEDFLNFEEKSWYTKYKEFKQNYAKTIQKMKLKKFRQSSSMENFFQLIHSAEYKEKTKAVPVFQPSKKTFEEYCEHCTDMSCFGE